MGKKGTSKYFGVFQKGQKFGKYSIVNSEVVINKEAQILCVCECGNQNYVSCWTLLNGKSKGCLECNNPRKLSKNPAWKGYNEIPYSWFSKYFERANRKRSGNISIKDVYDLWIKQNKKCSLSGLDIDFNKKENGITTSIDRIDSKKEYTIENIQLVHKDVNLMKNYFNQEYFLDICEKITNQKYIK